MHDANQTIRKIISATIDKGKNQLTLKINSTMIRLDLLLLWGSIILSIDNEEVCVKIQEVFSRNKDCPFHEEVERLMKSTENEIFLDFSTNIKIANCQEIFLLYIDGMTMEIPCKISI